MKGTYIKVLNDKFLVELEKLKTEINIFNKKPLVYTRSGFFI